MLRHKQLHAAKFAHGIPESDLPRGQFAEHLVQRKIGGMTPYVLLGLGLLANVRGLPGGRRARLVPQHEARATAELAALTC